MSIHKIKKQLEDKIAQEQAKQREAARRAQALGAKLTKATRQIDTRRKILAGSWALDKASRSPEFRAIMTRELDRVWLSRDDDRALFDLPALSDEEKARRKPAPGNGSGETARQDEKSLSTPDMRASSREEADAA